MPCRSTTCRQLSPSTTVYMMRPSGPGVAVTNWAGGAALAAWKGRAIPRSSRVIRIKQRKRVSLAFIRKNYIKNKVLSACCWNRKSPAIAPADLRQEIIIEEGVGIVIGLPAPVAARQPIIHVLGP